MESFHARLRDEFLNAEVFGELRHAQGLAAAWRRAYNEERPHCGSGYRTPAEFARAWLPIELAVTLWRRN